MTKVIVMMLFVSTAFVIPKPAVSQDYSTLFYSFNSSLLSSSDKRFLQAALAFKGYYNGLLDGDWGNRSKVAMQRYSESEFGEPSEQWHMALLAVAFVDEWAENGWEMRYLPSLGMSVLSPQKATIIQPRTDNFVNWRHTNSSLAYSVGRHSLQTTQSLHEYTLKWHKHGESPYTVRRSNFAVTTAKEVDGSILYTRSNLVNGGWSTIMLSAKRWDESTLNAVAASIEVGSAPPISFTEGGRLHDAIMKTVAILNGDEDEKFGQNRENVRENAKAPDAEKRESGSSAGTGFFVSETGHVLTNAHVVDGCSNVTVNGIGATVIAADEDFDLALLKTRMDADRSVAAFSAAPAKLNSDITVIGYPYAGILSGLNVTRGSVSSLKGLRGNPTTMQITAPVQMGNSGGPIVGSSGEVVGVVVAKIDALKFADATGDLPQSVNFAIRGEIAKLFLSQNGVDPVLTLDINPLEPVNLAATAQKFTTFIECD